MNMKMKLSQSLQQAIRIAAINDSKLYPVMDPIFFPPNYHMNEVPRLRANANLDDRQKVDRVRKITAVIKEVKVSVKGGLTHEAAVISAREQSTLDDGAWELVSRLSRL